MTVSGQAAVEAAQLTHGRTHLLRRITASGCSPRSAHHCVVVPWLKLGALVFYAVNS